MNQESIIDCTLKGRFSNLTVIFQENAKTLQKYGRHFSIWLP